MKPLKYQIGSFVLDCAAPTLSRHGQLVPLSAPALLVLSAFVRRPNQEIARKTLFDLAWPGVAVSDGSLTQAVWEIRRVLGEDISLGPVIKTIRGSGYRIVAPVSVLDTADTTAAAQPVVTYGRVRELALLQGLLIRVAAGACLTCYVSGPAAIGKSHLCRIAVQSARRSGWAVWSGRSFDAGSTPPFWPWLQMVDKQLDCADAATIARCVQLAPLSARLVPRLRCYALSGQPSPDAEHACPSEARANLLEDMAALTGYLTQGRPALLWLDDVHATDEATLSLLPVLVRTLQHVPVLILLSGRATTHEHRNLLQSLSRGDPERQISLSGLHVSAVRELLEARHEGVGAVAEDVCALTGGNPLFTLEVARLLASQPQLCRDPAALFMERELQELLTARLSHLSTDALQLLQAAAVQGRTFRVSDVCVLTQLNSERALVGVSELEAAGLIREASQGARFGFVHRLMREATYAATPRPARVRLHRALAEHLERSAPDPTHHLSEISHHYRQTAAWGTWEKSLQYSKKSGEIARDQTAYADAARHFEHALEAFDVGAPQEPRLRIELTLALGESLASAGAPTARVRRVFSDAAETAHTLQFDDLHARAALGYAGQHPLRFIPMRMYGTVDPREVALLERALARDAALDPQLRTLLRASLAFALACSRHRTRRDVLLAEAIAMARALESPWLLARALLVQVHTALGPAELARLRSAADELVALAASIDSRELGFEAHLARMTCRLQTADVSGARRDAALARRYAEQLGRPAALERAAVMDILSAFYQGDAALAARLTAQAATFEANDVRQRLVMALRMGHVWACQEGYCENARNMVRLMATTFPETEAWPAALACAAAALGDAEEARAQFDLVARDDFCALPEDHSYLPAMQLLAETAHRLDDAARAALIYERLLPYQDRLIYHGVLATPAGAVSWALGVLATTLRKRDLASHWFRTARTIYEQLDAPVFLAALDLSEARLLLTLGGLHERDQARALLARAKKFAEGRSVKWLMQDIATQEEASASTLENRPQRDGPRFEA